MNKKHNKSLRVVVGTSFACAGFFTGYAIDHATRIEIAGVAAPDCSTRPGELFNPCADLDDSRVTYSNEQPNVELVYDSWTDEWIAVPAE